MEQKAYTTEDYERCLAIANEAHRQLFMSITNQVYWSWGVSKRGYTFYNNMPTLMLRISGLLHKGWVYVSLNEGSDTYEVRLFDKLRKKCKNTVKDVYCDNLGEVIDMLVERPASYSDDVYFKKAMSDSKAKLS